MEELAIFGGTPVRKEKIYYGHQNIDQSDVDAAAKVLMSDYITCGPAVLKAEKDLTDYTGAQYATLVSNGTAALHLACIAAGIGPGDEVITTPLTFAASANCILYCGGTPVFADVNIDTYNIDPADVERKITEKTKAVIAVDFTGQAAQLDEIKNICNRHNLIFIEDAAHSIGTVYKDRKVGNIADITCFSFHPVKNITCGEGGAILTNSTEYDKVLKDARTHGIIHRPEDFTYPDLNEGEWYYEQHFLGYNYRLTDFQASILSNQIKKLDGFKKRRQSISDFYRNELKDVPGIILQEQIPESDSCSHLFIIRLDSNIIKCSRADFFRAMSKENIQCQIHYIPVYWFPYYQDKGYKMGICPNAENIYKHIMSIPFYPALRDEDCKDVVKTIKKVAKYYSR